MQKGLIGILGVLVLFLAAVNVRISNRARLLEEQLATLPRRPASASAPLPAFPGAESAQAPSVPVPAAAVLKASEPKRGDLPGPAPDPARQQNARLAEARIVDPQRIKTLQAVADPIFGNGFQFPALEDPDAGAGPRSGFLGIMGADVPGGGVLIQGVVPDSVALRSGLRPGDIVLELNGEPIDTLATLSARIRGAVEGVPVSLRLRRDGVDFYQGVQLGARTPPQR